LQEFENTAGLESLSFPERFHIEELWSAVDSA
jgi:hypothetical protein